MFQYDEQKALRSEAPVRITEPGAYLGTILQCEHCHGKNSASEFLRLMFKTDDGVFVWLNIVTKKGDGTESFGVGYVHALMGILGVQSMRPVPAKCRAWNGDVVEGERYHEVENKRIGFVLGMRDRKYTDQNGFERVIYDPQIVRIFDPVTRKTISETKKGLEANAVEREVETQAKKFDELKAKVEAERASFESQPRPNPQAATSAPIDNLDSDVPF